MTIDFEFADNNKYAINHYCIVSSNEKPENDPAAWQFLGSNDGINWELLDTQTDEKFEARKLRREFDIENNKKYSKYRLNITANNGGSTTEITEIQLFEYGPYPSEWALGPFEKLDEYNPIMVPNKEDVFTDPVSNTTCYWSEGYLYNPAAVVKDGIVHVMYRSQVKDKPLVSRVGLAKSTDGVTFDRNTAPVLYPDNDFMYQYEEGGGCEDPRVAKRPDGTYVMLYSCYNRTKNKCRLGVATSIDLENWTKQGLAFNDAYDGKYRDTWSKSGSVICDMVNGEMIAHKFDDGKYWMYWGEGKLYMAYSEDMIVWYPLENENGKLVEVMKGIAGTFDSILVEPGPPAIYTEKGILLIYNGANDNPNGNGDTMLAQKAYTPGMVLFDNNDPTKIVERSKAHFMYPEKDYEINGLVGNVCFVEGLVFYKDCWYLYYGTADSRLAVAKFVPPAVDKTALKAAIDEAEAIDSFVGVLPENKVEFDKALDIANSVYVSAIYRQNDVNEFTDKLKKATEGVSTIGYFDISADKNSYKINEKATLTVTTPKDIQKLKLTDNAGNDVLFEVTETYFDGASKIWTLTAVIDTTYTNMTINLNTTNGEIAAETGKMVSFAVLGITEISLSEIDVEKTNQNEYSYSFKMNASEAVNGTFVIALYNADGKCVGVKTEKMTDAAKEYEASGKTVETTDAANSYKVFFWNNMDNIKPLCKGKSGEF